MHEVGGSIPLAPTIDAIYKKRGEKLDLKKQIEHLIRLQAVDSEIYDLEAEKATFPVRIQENEAILQSKKAGMEAAEGVLKQLQVERKEKENDLASREEKIKKHEAELAAIKTNKEYKAMLEQIDSLRADVSLLEEKIIEVLDKAEEAKRVFDGEKKLFEEEKKKSDQEKSAIQAEQKKVEARLSELAGDRTKLKEPVDKEILAKYEQVLKNRGKTAIARIDGEFCGECNMRLRPQVINEARLKDNVVICESCQRILYTE